MCCVAAIRTCHADGRARSGSVPLIAGNIPRPNVIPILVVGEPAGSDDPRDRDFGETFTTIDSKPQARNNKRQIVPL